MTIRLESPLTGVAGELGVSVYVPTAGTPFLEEMIAHAD